MSTSAPMSIESQTTSGASATATSGSQSELPIARLNHHLTTALQQLWTSALIVEQGVAPIQPTAVNSLDPSLERLMGLAEPKLTIQDMTNQHLQKQMSEYKQQQQMNDQISDQYVDGYLQSLLDIDRVGRQIALTVPKSVIDCVESGHNPSLITQRYIEETKFKHESVRAKVFATKVLHDQLKLRFDLWNEMLSKEAAAGNKTSDLLLHSTLDTLKQHRTT